ncbi:DNA/RNA nuclease SfsA [Ornithinibacillus halotolerans]|uniref:Sugar fermentation stimulation protein homolog n=1 Tax=Ornithinibacillus halotolerans TaxID=1274357 RepID=A0A916S341_9BACI|nr:DNA/RNA nuclease SfsA [Ornithinibacillus halotolerans]GGA79185.1 sugar fermentation stimulation protein SfsA [Ornithinibacillus halotolerans]
MKYGKIVHGILHRKVNRFIAEVFIDGVLEQVHIKNTGRLQELLISGVDVLLEWSTNPNRKTRFSLISVWKKERLVNIDSQAPNKVAYEAILAGKIKEISQVDVLKREVTYGDSRFDLYYEKGDEKGFIEVKGVTLEQDGVAMFPDAPTSRGTKHVLKLIRAREEGYRAMILFVIQMKGCHSFTPHLKMDEKFSRALQTAFREGVVIMAYDSIVTEDGLVIDKEVPVVVP